MGGKGEGGGERGEEGGGEEREGGEGGGGDGVGGLDVGRRVARDGGFGMSIMEVGKWWFGLSDGRA